MSPHTAPKRAEPCCFPAPSVGVGQATIKRRESDRLAMSNDFHGQPGVHRGRPRRYDTGHCDGSPRRHGAVYGEEYRQAEAFAVVEAVRAGRPIPPTPTYAEGES